MSSITTFNSGITSTTSWKETEVDEQIQNNYETFFIFGI